MFARKSLLISLCCLFPLAGAALAQPAPSFRADCETVEAQISEHRLDDGALATFEVTGTLLLAHSDGVLAYMGMCAAPHPKILCVTYTLGEYQVGDRVSVVGAYRRAAADMIVLDPCLHHPASHPADPVD